MLRFVEIRQGAQCGLEGMIGGGEDVGCDPFAVDGSAVGQTDLGDRLVAIPAPIRGDDDLLDARLARYASAAKINKENMQDKERWR